ncbi:hypothetical protein ACS0TY_020987 [Phlomoides rotata]
MGGKMKGMHAYSSSSSCRRRWMNVYVMMAIVCAAFVCGVLGVMGLNRLKERNILNLLIKQKHDQILSLHHLLQKERELMQEAKKKTEEMKVNIFNLRAQKSDLNNRVLEMQSKLSSLRDEHRAIELAFQEKQNEAKLLRDQYMEIKDQKRQVEALTEALQQKEAEIEDLKHRLQLDEATKVGSTSVDEHSILPANMSTEEHGESERSINGRSETVRNEDVDKLENYQERRSENKDLEMRENSDNGTYKFRGRHKPGYLKRAKGKRWRMVEKQTEEQRLQNGDHGLIEGFKIQNSTRLQNESVSKNHQVEKDKLPEEPKPEQDAEDTSHRVANFDESNSKETMAENNDSQRDNQLGQEEVAERYDEPDGSQMEHLEQSELGEESEDKEQANEPEF